MASARTLEQCPICWRTASTLFAPFGRKGVVLDFVFRERERDQWARGAPILFVPGLPFSKEAPPVFEIGQILSPQPINSQKPRPSHEGGFCALEAGA